MIHTAEFYANLQGKTIGEVERNFKANIGLINENINTVKFGAVRFDFRMVFGVWRFFFIIDFIKLLQKSEISEIDYLEIEKRIEKILLGIFKNEVMNVELILKRLDFRKDIIISSQNRDVLLKLYKKARKSYRLKKKNIEYDTTIYYTSKAMCITIYDKEKERIFKNKEIQEYEKNVLRLEIRLFPRHLSVQKRERELKSYLTDDVFNKYRENNSFPIFYKGNHYKLEKIEKILIDNNVKAKDKNNILMFLNHISNYGFSSAINKKNDKGELIWSYYKVKKYIKLLENLNINPFIIPIREEIDMIENKFMQ